MAVGNLNSGAGIPPTIIDAKGDLLVGTADNVVNRLGVTGTTGAVLTADAGETTGLKWAAAGSVGGLVHINTTSFSAVSSQSLDNVFSTTYKNYRVVVNFVCSTDTTLNIRLRVGGVDNSASNSYIFQSAQFSNTASAFARATGNQWTGFDAPSIRHGISFDLFNSFEALVTTGSSVNLYFDSTSIASQIQGLYHNVASSFDGISIYPSSGTITGSISILAYRN